MSVEKSAAVRGVFWVLTASVLWSTAGVAIKWLDGIPPFGLSAGRALIACFCFLALLRGRVLLPGQGRLHVILGAVIYALVVTSFVLANRFTTAANAILLQYTAPLWIALMGWVFLKERPTRQEMLALLLGGGGVVLCMYEGLSLLADSGNVSHSLIGDGIALFSGVCFAAMTIVFRRFGRAAVSSGLKDQSSLFMLFYGNIIAVLLGGVVLAVQLSMALSETGGRISVSVSTEGILVPIGGILVLLWLGVFQLAGGYWCYQRGLRSIRALTASLLCLIEPLLNPLWVVILVGEIPRSGTIAGGVLVLISVIWILAAQYRGAGAIGAQ